MRIWGLPLLLAVLLTGATDRPHASLLTSLPLMWGEGDPSDILAGRVKRSDTLTRIEASIDLRAIDTVTAATLGSDIAMIAQPRRLTPRELANFDAWLRSGGRAMIFADPELVWPSAYPPGDRRRAPPVTLLDPLFAHWGVMLGDSDHAEHRIWVHGAYLTLLAGGTWTGPAGCSGTGTYVLDCPIGKGRVLLVGDADVLDKRLWHARNADNPAWIVRQLQMLNGTAPSDSTRFPNGVVAAVATALLIMLGFIYRQFVRT